MARINVVLSDEIEHKLRKTIVDLPDFGGRKGDLSEAIEQAIKEWIEKHERDKRKERS